MSEDAPPKVPPAAVLALRRSVAGEVLHPTDPAFPPRLRAAVAVRLADEADADAALRVMAEHGLGLDRQVRLLVDRLTDVRIDPEAGTAEVGAGTTWSELARAAEAAELAPVPGHDGAERIAETLRYGGLGPLAASHGWCSNHLRSLHHRHAGALSLVTSAELALVPAPRLVVEVHDRWHPGGVATIDGDGIRTTTVELAEDGVGLADHLDAYRGPPSAAAGLLLTRVDDEVVEALTGVAGRLSTAVTLQPLVPGFAEPTRGATYLVSVSDPAVRQRLAPMLEPWLTGATWPPA